MAGSEARWVAIPLPAIPQISNQDGPKMSAEQIDEFERQFFECLAAMIAALADGQ